MRVRLRNRGRMRFVRGTLPNRRATPERVEILAAIAHDLQTPITRMRLRTDLMDNERDRSKFRQELDAMSTLVRQGLAYAQTLHGTQERPTRIDADALFESMLADYEDAGKRVLLEGLAGRPIVTRPNALRRIVTNLIDNALKFGSDVRLTVQAGPDRLAVCVLTDRAFRPINSKPCSSPFTGPTVRAAEALKARAWAWPSHTGSPQRWVRS